MDDDFRLSRRRGWLASSTPEQRQAWFEDCVVRNQDCLYVVQGNEVRSLVCHANPAHPISPLAYKELEDLVERWELPGAILGEDYGPGYFTLDIPSNSPLEELIEEVRACLRRDRTVRRQVELRDNLAREEGMAIALRQDGLWPDHQLHQEVYVLEVSPGRCLVLKHLHPPLLDLPLSQFRIRHE